MSSDADAHRVGSIPVTLMVLGNTIRSGVFLLPANLTSTGGIAIYGWLVTIIGALGFLMVYVKTSFFNPNPGGSCAYARRCFGPFLGYQTDVLYWLACWTGNTAMVVIGVGYLSYFFLILKDSLVLTITCVVVLWIFVLLSIVGSKVITRIQTVATVLALIPIVGIAVLSWFWFCGEAYTAAWNVSGPSTFSVIQSILNATLQSLIGVESIPVAAGVVRSPRRNVPITIIGGILITAVRYMLPTTVVMGITPSAALRVSAPLFGGTARMALGDTAGAIAFLCTATGCLGSLSGWTLLAGQMVKAAADDGLSPPILVRVNKTSTSVVGLIIVGILMTIFRLSSILSNVTREFGLVSSVSVASTLVPYLYARATLLLLGHGHFGKARPVYLVVTTIALLHRAWAMVGSGAKKVMWSFVTLMVIAVMYTLNYNRLHKNPHPSGAPTSKDQLPLTQQT